MTIYQLRNGNHIKITKENCYSDLNSTKVWFEYEIIQKNGYWKHTEQATISLDYYGGIYDYITTNYETV